MIRSATFKPAWWLPGPHLQTVWPVLFRKRPDLDVSLERVDLPDGDFIDLAWTRANNGPIVLVLHGLEGSLESHYASGVLHRLSQTGFQALFMHFRGCSGEPNRLPRSYHSGDTQDLVQILEYIRRTKNRSVSAVIGFSLGGNVLLKYLGEYKERAIIKAGVAVSVPFRLQDAARRLELGPSRIYRDHLLKKLRASYWRKFKHRLSPLDVQIGTLNSFYEFDDRVTAPLHGFSGADDYYSRSSCRPFLKYIRTPTLILHARDDPFMWPSSIPENDELSSTVALELSEHGGHVGFVTGAHPWRARYWLDQRIIEFLARSLVS